MLTINRLDVMFGPSGTAAGYVLIIAGAIMVFQSLSAIVLIIIGAFVGFTSTSTMVDFDHKRMKFSNNIFGLIRIGKWIDIEYGMKAGVEKTGKTWRTYSRSNRILDTASKDYRIFLYDTNGNRIMPVMKTESFKDAELQLENLTKKMGIGQS